MQAIREKTSTKRQIPIWIFFIPVIVFAFFVVKCNMDGNKVKPDIVIEHIKSVTVSITNAETGDWNGTGVIVHKVYKPFVKTYILTANHVIKYHNQSPQTVHVIVPRNGVFAEDIFLPMKVELVGDDIYDLALISVNADIGEVATAFAGVTLMDERTYACAGINGGINVVTEGKITGKMIAERRDRHSACSSFGHSGSAVFNYKGEVIGILSQMVMDQVPFGMFAIPAPIRSRLLYVPMRDIRTWVAEGGMSWSLN